jgi:hypothetical protein
MGNIDTEKRKGKKKKTALVGVPLIDERLEEINKSFSIWELGSRYDSMT